MQNQSGLKNNWMKDLYMWMFDIEKPLIALTYMLFSFVLATFGIIGLLNMQTANFTVFESYVTTIIVLLIIGILLFLLIVTDGYFKFGYILLIFGIILKDVSYLNVALTLVMAFMFLYAVFKTYEAIKIKQKEKEMIKNE